MTGDLHTHTNFSDGSTDIEILPGLAARAGLTHLAVTDHDTVLAAEYAYAFPVVEGVHVIPATELTAFDEKRGRRVHLLCYYPMLTDDLRSFCALMGQRRNEANARSAAEIEKLYPQFTRQAALQYAARGGVLYKTHLIRVLFDYGYTDGIYKALYKTLFSSPDGAVLHEPAYESVDTVLSIVKRAGGVCVLAHPSVYDSLDLAAELAAAGRIDGVEIDHPRNREEDKAVLHALARQHDLIVTGGTDFHGLHMARPVPLGALQTTQQNITRLQQLANARKN